MVRTGTARGTQQTIANQTHGTWLHCWWTSARDVLVSVFYGAAHSFFIAKFVSSSPLSYSLSVILYFLSGLKTTE